jgi:nitroreductase
MELKEAIYHRRAVRDFTETAVPVPLINEMLHAAIHAPSAMNQQPWAFAVITGRDRLRAYSERTKSHLLSTLAPVFELHPRSQLYADPDYNIGHDAGVLIVIYASGGRLHPAEDCCLAAENLMLTAHALELGSCPVGFARGWLDLPQTKAEFGITSDHTAVFPVVIGYPAKRTEPVPRREPVILCWK